MKRKREDRRPEKMEKEIPSLYDCCWYDPDCYDLCCGGACCR